MKKVLTAIALVALTASSALAQGLNAKWGACGAAGTSNTTSTCGTLVTRILYLSFIAPATGASQTVGYNIKVTHGVNGGPLNCWWNFVAGGPRAAGFGLAGGTLTSGCDNFLAFFGSPNAAGGWQDLGDGRGRFNLFVANPDDQFGNTGDAPGTEFYAGEVQIKGTGTTSCPTGATDCQAGAQVRLNDIVLVQDCPGAPGTCTPPANLGLNQPASANSNCGTWQAGGICDAATPTNKATWGSLKSLYR